MKYTDSRLMMVLAGLGWLALSASAFAANQTTPGAVTLSSTFECISVRAAFSGDDNANNSARIQFRRAGTTTWLNAYTPAIDRRTSVNGNDNSANAFQARGSIVGLTPNASYEIQVTWTDADGITGSAASTASVSTLSYNPPAPGTTRYVDASAGSEGSGTSSSPFKTITNAIAQSNAGDTIIVRAGSYPSFTISKSGTASAYFVLKANPGDTVTIQATSSSCLTIDANYWRIIGFRFAPAVESSMVVAASRHHIYIEDTVSTDISTGNVWGSGGVSTRSNVNNIYILRNTFTRTTTGIDNVDGVFIEGAGTHTLVIADNTITGSFWDAIGNGVNSLINTMENSDFCRNTLTGFQDDSIEMDGGSVNLRVYGNTGRSSSFSLLSEAGTMVGPSYIFRNTFVNTKGDGSGLKQGHNGIGPCFIFHNLFQTAGAGSNEAIGQAGGTAYSENHVFRNNIIVATGNAYYKEGRSNSYDYNVLYSGTYTLVSAWNGSGTYDTLASFRSGTGQEMHAINADPLLNTDKTLRSGSPAIDKGVTLPNFNDANSAWPSSGTAPDIGAFEVGGSVTQMSAPTNLRVVP